jgi:hypothetical protein
MVRKLAIAPEHQREDQQLRMSLNFAKGYA